MDVIGCCRPVSHPIFLTKSKEQTVIDSEKYPCTAGMTAKLQGDETKTAYRKRKWIAEPPNGAIRTRWGIASSR